VHLSLADAFHTVYTLCLPGMGSLRTGLDLEDSSRIKFCGLGLGLDDPWPWPRRPLALALALASKTPGLGLALGLDHVVLDHVVDDKTTPIEARS